MSSRDLSDTIGQFRPALHVGMRFYTCLRLFVCIERLPVDIYVLYVFSIIFANVIQCLIFAVIPWSKGLDFNPYV